MIDAAKYDKSVAKPRHGVTVAAGGRHTHAGQLVPGHRRQVQDVRIAVEHILQPWHECDDVQECDADEMT